MICNELKDKLPEGWREKFVHRDCDQANYEFAMFEIDGENKILVRNPDTDDIMEYYYDDFDGKISISGFIESMGYKEQDRRKYYIDRDYNWYSIGESDGKSEIRSLFSSFCMSTRVDYPTLTYMADGRKVGFRVHRMVAFMFIPNPNPTDYNIINHIDRNHKNFHKENLEWCDAKINARTDKRDRSLKFEYRAKGETTSYTYWGLKSAGYHPPRVLNSIQTKTKYKGKYWEKIDTTLEDYLSRHPIDPNGWYDDNGLHDFGKHKVRANSCGVLEVDGVLKIGNIDKYKLVYGVTINRSRYYVSRLIFEIVTGKLIDNGNVIDHITPTSLKDIDNSISNLREVSQKENMNNSLTKEKWSIKVRGYNLFGEYIKEFSSMTDAAAYSNSNSTWVKTTTENTEVFPVCNDMIFINSKNPEDKDLEWIEDKLSYVYYRFSKDRECICGNKYITRIVPEENLSKSDIDTKRSLIRQYLNTGMPAPDGYYYQQGDPWNMIYDPDNKGLIKKRPEIFWKDRNKNREDD